MKETRLRLGKQFYEDLKNNKKSHFKYDMSHPYIQEYLDSIENVKVAKPKKKKVK